VADFTKRNGIVTANIVNMSGIQKATRSKFNNQSLPLSDACRWIAGDGNGWVYMTDAGGAARGWTSIVDYGTGLAKDLTYGKDSSGANRWVIGATMANNGIVYADAGLTDLTNASNWTSVDIEFDGKDMTAVDGGPGIAWGDTTTDESTWISGGITVTEAGTGDEASIKLSTNGGTTWSAVAPTALPSLNSSYTRTMVFAGGDTWFAASSNDVWQSADNGASWTMRRENVSNDIYAMASGSDAGAGSPSKPNLWVTVGNQGAINWSDDDWATSSIATDSRNSGPFHNVPGGGGANNHKVMGVVYAAGTINRWVAVSKSATDGDSGLLSPVIAYSTDGDNWTKATITDYTGTDSIWCVATDNTTVVAAGSNGKIFTSTDGETFTVQTAPNSPSPDVAPNFRSIACDVIVK
jgi:hypothetical protein